MVEILYKSNNAVVIYKPHGIPAQSDPSGCKDALTITSELLEEMGESGALWLIHRLDRGVGGVMIFARTKKSAAELSGQVKSRQMVKEYLAVVEGETDTGNMQNYLYKDARGSKAYIVDRKRNGVKEARLAYETLAHAEADGRTLSLLRVKLFTGRTHQIRVQLAHRRHPLCGDARYGAKTRGELALFSHTLTLPHPKNGREWSIAALPAPVGFFSPFADFFTSPAPLSDCPN